MQRGRVWVRSCGLGLCQTLVSSPCSLGARQLVRTPASGLCLAISNAFDSKSICVGSRSLQLHFCCEYLIKQGVDRLEGAGSRRRPPLVATPSNVREVRLRQP